MQWLADGRAPSPALVGGFYRAIFAKLYRGLRRSRTDAEDATQEVFLVLKRRSGDIRTSPRQYAHGIARFGIQRHLARRYRRGEEVPLADLDDVPAEAPSAHEAIERRDDVTRLVAALGELPLEDQRCLAWVYGRELKNVEAAARLGLGTVAFNNLLRSARGRLRTAMQLAELAGARPERSVPTFQQWVDSVLDPRDAQAVRSPAPPLGNRSR